MDWLANHFDVRQNYGNGQQWKYYYFTHSSEPAGLAAFVSSARTTGIAWAQRRSSSSRNGCPGSGTAAVKKTMWWRQVLRLLFLAKGRAPVLINKLRHRPEQDWNNDPDDIRNIVSIVSPDWKNLLAWQVVDPRTATIQEMLQPRSSFSTATKLPTFRVRPRRTSAFVEQGGFIFAELVVVTGSSTRVSRR